MAISLFRLLQSPAFQFSVISTWFLPENLNDFCSRLKLLRQEKRAGNESDMINEKS